MRRLGSASEPQPAMPFLAASDQAVEEADAMAVYGTFEDPSENQPAEDLSVLTPGSLEAEGWHGVVGSQQTDSECLESWLARRLQVNP